MVVVMHVRRLPVPAVDLGGSLQVEVAEAGAGGRPVLLVHGFTGSKEDFTDFVDPLAERGWHAVAPDLRGHGGSDHPPGEHAYDLELFAADQLALADALGWGSFVLVGHSMGGAVAQRIVLDRPERVAALVLMSTFTGRVHGVEPQLVEMGTQVVRTQGMETLLELQTQLRDADPFSSSTYSRLRHERPGWAEHRRRTFLAASPDMWTAMARRFVSDGDRLVRLANVSVPTLVVVGQLDRTMLDDCRRVAGTIPGARLVELPDTGHSPQLEAPGRLLGILDDFLGRKVA
jgi:pimeloyl-ACP methyl ester carboxylesterase